MVEGDYPLLDALEHHFLKEKQYSGNSQRMLTLKGLSPCVWLRGLSPGHSKLVKDSPSLLRLRGFSPVLYDILS